jgi:hypothetical protein
VRTACSFGRRCPRSVRRSAILRDEELRSRDGRLQAKYCLTVFSPSSSRRSSGRLPPGDSPAFSLSTDPVRQAAVAGPRAEVRRAEPRAGCSLLAARRPLAARRDLHASCRRFGSRPDGLSFWLALPARIAHAAGFPARCGRVPDGLRSQRRWRAARTRACAIIVEVHGDRRTSTRLYGRCAASSQASATAAAPCAERTQSARRRSPPASFASSASQPTGDSRLHDLEPFTLRRSRCPTLPVALFVKVFEQYKNITVSPRRGSSPRRSSGRRPTARGQGSRAGVARSSANTASVGRADVGGSWQRSTACGPCCLLARRAWAACSSGVLSWARRRRNARRLIEPRRRRSLGPPRRRRRPDVLADALVRVLSDRAGERPGGALAAAAPYRRLSSTQTGRESSSDEDRLCDASRRPRASRARCHAREDSCTPRRVDEVVVLADSVVPEAPPDNCVAHSFAAS